MHDVLEVTGRLEVAVLAGRLDDIGDRVRKSAGGPVDALAELARAVATLHTAGLVSGAAALECARLLDARMSAAARSGERCAGEMLGALGQLTEAEAEVARGVGGR